MQELCPYCVSSESYHHHHYHVYSYTSISSSITHTIMRYSFNNAGIGVLNTVCTHNVYITNTLTLLHTRNYVLLSLLLLLLLCALGRTTCITRANIKRIQMNFVVPACLWTHTLYVLYVVQSFFVNFSTTSSFFSFAFRVNTLTVKTLYSTTMIPDPKTVYGTTTHFG